MRILIFSTSYLPFIGGAELAIKEITDRIPALSFTLITARFTRAVPTHERIGNVDVYRVGLGYSFDKWLLPWLGLWHGKRLNAVEPFDIAWSMMASQASIAAAWFKKAFPAKKLVLTLQEGDEEEHLKRYVFGNDFLYRLLIRRWHAAVFKHADIITAISEYLAARARKNLSLQQEGSLARVEVIPNGVNVERFKIYDLRFKNEELRNSIGFRPEDKIIITTSRLVKKNGIQDLIESLQYLPAHIKLLICGVGPLESSLKLAANRYMLNDRVRFLGHIPHTKLPRYLHGSDIFCRPSLSEGMGSSFIEAMAAGLPVIATPVGGIPDFLHSPSILSKGGLEGGGGNEEEKHPFSNSHELENGWGNEITGLFCEAGNPRDIAEKVQLLFSNKELRERIIANGSKMVREKYDWSGIAERMKDVLTKK